MMRVSHLSVRRVAYIPTYGISRSERPRKSRIGTEVDYVTRNSDTTFNVDKGQGHQAAVAAAMGPNVLAVCCYVAVSSAARGASAPTGRREAGHIVTAVRLQLVYQCSTTRLG